MDKETRDKFDEVIKDVQGLAIDSNTNTSNIDNIKEKLDKVEEKVDALAAKIATNKDEIVAAVKAEFVKYVEFEPVKTLVFGLVGVVLITVLVAVLALVVVPSVQQGAHPSPPGVSAAHGDGN